MQLILLPFAVWLTVVSCSSSGRDASTSPVDTLNTTATLDGRLRVPTGFNVAYFAENVSGVRFMAVSPDGAVYASQPGRGRVVRLADANHDGKADGVVEVVSGLSQPHGLAFHKGLLYVANTDGVVRVPLGADGVANGAPVYVNHFPGGGGHWSRTIVFGADSAMYVAIGSSCNLCVESSRRSAPRCSGSTRTDRASECMRWASGTP